MKTATGFPALIRAFHLALTVEGLRPRTVANYVGDVKRFATGAGYRNPASITSTDIRTWLGLIQGSRAPKTVREAQLALRRFFRFLVQEREIRRDPTREMKLMTCQTDPQPTYTELEVKRLILVCDAKTSAGIRDRALLLTLFDTGAREGELISMGLPDWERRRVRVSGKTGIRYVPLGMATLQALERYVRRWNIADRPLWRGKKGPLTGSGVLQLVRRRCRQAGVS